MVSANDMIGRDHLHHKQLNNLFFPVSEWGRGGLLTGMNRCIKIVMMPISLKAKQKQRKNNNRIKSNWAMLAT